MKKSIPITVAALAVATAAVAGCTPVAPTPPAAFSTLPAPASAVSQVLRDRDLNSRAQLDRAGQLAVAGGVDLQLAEAAAADHVPFVFAYDDVGGGCAWLRLPDASLWGLHGGGGALTRDTAREEFFRRTPAAAMALGCEQEAVPIGYDAEAADAAARAGSPYRWQEVDPTTRTRCKELVRVPDSKKTFYLPDRMTPRGDALTPTTQYGVLCGTTTIGGK
ncbi:hypothetical protein [Mycobacteroides abscessus]|uniref:hypothetical protein n=1 Tax=Mycobacteroides abscessus TaxID=36809 RepID=UPI0005DE90AD|nr:hypothetical protein [Mycobacteroides abscessus]CPR70136.1 Uncharacterised protein [Mycobacteroides abscessus]CPU70422.1 Uncharacterised protein [Mycobacteroides abscessus]